MYNTTFYSIVPFPHLLITEKRDNSIVLFSRLLRCTGGLLRNTYGSFNELTLYHLFSCCLHNYFISCQIRTSRAWDSTLQQGVHYGNQATAYKKLLYTWCKNILISLCKVQKWKLNYQKTCLHTIWSQDNI